MKTLYCTYQASDILVGSRLILNASWFDKRVDAIPIPQMKRLGRVVLAETPTVKHERASFRRNRQVRTVNFLEVLHTGRPLDSEEHLFAFRVAHLRGYRMRTSASRAANQEKDSKICLRTHIDINEFAGGLIRPLRHDLCRLERTRSTARPVPKRNESDCLLSIYRQPIRPFQSTEWTEQASTRDQRTRGLGGSGRRT